MSTQTNSRPWTAGPWRVIPWARTGTEVAFSVEGSGNGTHAVCDCRGTGPNAAKAALIAAAPELFEALQGLLNTPPGTDPVEILKADDRARAALRKAGAP